MSSNRTRSASATSRKPARTTASRKASTTVKRPGQGETIADAANVLRKAIGNKVEALTDLATQFGC